MGSEIPIIDSHIHLFPASELTSLAWQKPDGPLYKQQSVDEYKAATTTTGGTTPTPPPTTTTKGFIIVEADRKVSSESDSNNNGSNWTELLAEVSFVRRIVTGQPKEGEGHGAEDAPLCLAYVPWAPVASGPEALEKYIEQAKEAAGEETWSKVKGFRYLLQDKPSGTALQDRFIEGLKLLGRRGFVFDVGVDQHRRGRLQLEEAVEMIDRAHDGVPEEEKVVFILNHMCKPDLEIYNVQTSPAFIAWRTAMFTLSRCSRTYVKLSGGFSEMGDALRRRPAEDIFDAISPWLSVLLAAFGPARIMFGSDWPICTIGMENDGDEEEGEGSGNGNGNGNGNAWQKWKKVVDRICYMMSYGEEAKTLIWGGTAVKAYGIEL